MSDIQTVFLIVVVTIGLFIWNRLPLIVVAMGSAVSLYLTGLLTLGETFSGLGDPVIVFIAAMFVVTAGLEATGVTAWAGRLFEDAVSGSRMRLQVLSMLGVAALCPFINATGAVAALMPVLMLLAVRLKERPARLLMPFAFASGAGSHLALTGAPKNVLISDAAFDAGAGGIGFFEFAWVGLPLLAGTIAIVLLLGDRLLPKRNSASLPPDLSRHAQTLVAQYRLASDVFRLQLLPGSPLIGRSALDAGLGDWPGLRLVTVVGPDGAPRISGPLAEGDVLLVRGAAEPAGAYAEGRGLRVEEVSGDVAARKFVNRLAGVVEVVIPPRSPFIGRSVYPGMPAASGDLVIVAMQRNGEDVVGATEVLPGDHLLLQGSWAALDRHRNVQGVLMVDRPDDVRKQVIAFGLGAPTMLVIVAAMVIAIATGLLPPSVAAVLAAGVTLLMGFVTVDEAYRAINWTTVILMAGMFPLSAAMYQSGAAQLIADSLVAATGAGSPRLLLLGVFGLGVGLGIVISNTATTLILIPIAILAAEAFGISPLPVLMTLSVATSASFLTPVSTPVNTMVMGPAGYTFGDYWRLGLPLTLFYLVVALWLVPLIWPF